MKSTTEILELLRTYKAHSPAKYGVKRLGIFGSVARGEQLDKDTRTYEQPPETTNIKRKYLCMTKILFLLRDEINHPAREINSSRETEISVLRAEWIYPVRWKSWRPQHPYYKSHLRGRVPSCGRRHARFLQLLFQSGSGAYPFVKLLDGRLLLHTAYIHARQFAFAVAAHDKRFLYNIFICLFHVG